MSTDVFDFARVIHPWTPTAFLREVWGQRPLVLSRNAPEHYAGLLRSRTIEDLLASFGSARPEHLRIVRDGKPIDVAPFLGPEGRVDPTRLYPALLAGYSLALGDGRRIPELAPMLAEMERATSYPANATLFLSPPGERAFEAHIDTADTLVMQLAGAKDWRIHGPVPLFPRRVTHAIADHELPALLHEVTVEPGDLIYVPAGYVHSARSSAGPSLSLSAYFDRCTFRDLLIDMVSAWSETHAAADERLPPGFLTHPSAPEELRAHLRGLVSAMCEQASVDDALDAYAARALVGWRPPPGGPLVTYGRATTLSRDTVVRVREGVEARVIRREGAARVVFTGGELRGPPRIEDALRFIVRTREFAVAAISTKLTDDEKLVLVRRLIREGMLAVVPDG